ncbi:AP2 domain-containing protein [Enterococcus casseliflavus]|nr:AP2 domain-containing protein [Enterococcus casseliflavus]
MLKEKKHKNKIDHLFKGEQSNLEIFGRLRVLRTYKKKNSKMAYCICDCGKEKEVYYSNIKSGRTRSCGCLERENREKYKDLSNQVFGRLVALYPTDKRVDGCVVWLCQCSCGKRTMKSSKLLLKGEVKSCGCLRDNNINLKDSEFGNLRVLYPKDENYNWKTLWVCACACGQNCSVSSSNLLYGHTKSCGCLKRKEYRTLIDGTVIECLNTKLNKNNTSGVKGVYRSKNKWVAYITFKKKRYYLGAFNSIKEAACARKKAEEELFLPLLERFM